MFFSPSETSFQNQLFKLNILRAHPNIETYHKNINNSDIGSEPLFKVLRLAQACFVPNGEKGGKANHFEGVWR